MIPIIDALMPVLGKILDFIPNPKDKAEAQIKLTEEVNRHSEEILKAVTQVDVAQAGINTEEAKSSNLFVSGWRPFVGWVCGAGTTWAFVVKPLFDWFLAIYHPEIKTPDLPVGELISLLVGMLGFGGMRMYEKTQGVQNNH